MFTLNLLICPGCGWVSSQVICKSCKASLRSNQHFLPSPLPGITGIVPLWFAWERTQSIIRSWKNSPGRLLEKQLFQVHPLLLIKLLALDAAFIVPIPQAQSRNLRRGHASALSIAEFLGRTLNIPVCPLITLTESLPQQQTESTRFDRIYSRNIFQINNSQLGPLQLMVREFKNAKISRGLNIILVDDIVTTGSTLAKAAAIMNQVLPECKIWGAALAYRPVVLKNNESRSTYSRSGIF